MTKTKKDNYMIDNTYAVYTKNEIMLRWSIRLDSVCDKN